MKKTLTLIFALFAILIFACSCGTDNGNLSASVIAEGSTGVYLTGCYARVDEIDGDCTDSKYDKWIDVIDFDLGTQYDQGSLKATIDPLVIVHKVDSATPHLQHHCVLGTAIKHVTLEKTIRSGGTEKKTFSVAIKNARMISAEINCDANGNIIETLKFNYESATLEYTPINMDGTYGYTVTDTIIKM